MTAALHPAEMLLARRSATPADDSCQALIAGRLAAAIEAECGCRPDVEATLR